MTETQPSLPDSTAGRFELPARAASGLVMGAAIVAALIGGGAVFAAIVTACAIAALREWHRLIAGKLVREMIPTSLAMVVVAVIAYFEAALVPALLAILIGAALAAGSATLRRQTALWPIPWHAFGAVYIGLTLLALVLLRDAPRGAAIVGGLFVAVWTTDTAALVFGRLIGGPKLAPDLSPNKTWAGFLGGVAAAAAAEAIYVFALNGSAMTAAFFGVLLAVSGNIGDLFESWVKRQFRAKNTGRLIPGHGGMLDRIDSLLFAAPICAMLIYFGGPNPFAAGSP